MTGRPESRGPYARVYHSIVEDPMFDVVYRNDHALATWLRMLIVADAMYPTSAPMPHRNFSVRLLISSGLVVERPNGRYSVRGLTAERERRSDASRIAAAVRWQSDRNATEMPSKAKQSINEQSSAIAQKPTTFMGFPAKQGHAGQHPDCEVCGTATIPENGDAESYLRFVNSPDHLIQEKARKQLTAMGVDWQSTDTKETT